MAPTGKNGFTNAGKRETLATRAFTPSWPHVWIAMISNTPMKLLQL
jgi:hypothetical protein